MHEVFRKIPKMDHILKRPDVLKVVSKYGQPYVVQVMRDALFKIKHEIRQGQKDVEQLVELHLSKALEEATLKPLQAVVNATGVILHTNLGRAPYGRELLDEVSDVLCSATSLEIDLLSGQRGVRGDFVRETLARVSGAEDALVVNNNAAALVLILSCFGKGREVIVSRGELIQIGGGFRIPEIIEQGGARLVEVGTTNITSLEDYKQAINDNTAALLKVHLSNFHQEGFTKRPSTSELAGLKTDDLPFIEDLGSGNLLESFDDFNFPDHTPARIIADGADLVCFSGDKLLGGSQAGLIVGRADLIEKLAAFPLMRAIRPDKFCYAMLQVVLRHYEENKPELVSPWRQLSSSRTQIIERIKKFKTKYELDDSAFPIVETYGEFGAGSLPGKQIESAAIEVCDNKPDQAAIFFRRSDPSVLGMIQKNKFLLDFLAISDQDEANLAKTIKAYLSR